MYSLSMFKHALVINLECTQACKKMPCIDMYRSALVYLCLLCKYVLNQRFLLLISVPKHVCACTLCRSSFAQKFLRCRYVPRCVYTCFGHQSVATDGATSHEDCYNS